MKDVPKKPEEMEVGKALEEGSVVDRVLDMFVDSVILQSLITLILVIANVAVWMSPNVEAPDELTFLTTTVVGFWFGQKVQIGSKRSAEKIVEVVTNKKV